MNNAEIRPHRARLKPPVVGSAINEVCARRWDGSALGPHIPELERLMMLDPNAPATFDEIPMLSATRRNKALVDGVTQSLRVNPDLAPMVRRVGAALKTDRADRLQRPDDGGLEALAEVILRQIEVKPTFRPRG